MQSRIARIFLSKLIFWLVVLFVGLYFLFSIDFKRPEQIEKETGKQLSFVQKILDSIRMPRLKLGIDLRGGTYLVVGVEIEKAIENRLQIESKNLDQLFEKKNIKALPIKKEIKEQSLILSFDDEEKAKICFNFIKREIPTLKVSLKDFVVNAVLTPAEEQRIRIGSVEQAVNVLSNRLSGFGVEGIVVQQHGDKQIVVQLPGVDDPERVKSVITKTAHLDFKIVEKVAASKQALLDDFDGDLPSDKMIVLGRKENNVDYDVESGRAYLVSAFPDLTGNHIVDSKVTYGEYNRVEVSFQLDSSGAREFRELTGNNIGRRLGIIIDDVMYTAPTIESAIGGSGRITGIGTPEEAKDLALVLRSGALIAPLKFEQETRVGASLGADSIYKGIISCLIALLLLFIFSIFYYKIPGFFAIIALFYNLFLILLFLSYFESALTLPGIAGMVLTIGMAVDASILIYERIKEELATGTTFRKALNDGFKGAMVVILDSNITTFLTGFILFKFGGPAIKGFAVTLMVGIIATILSGVYFLKSIYEFILDNTDKKTFKF
ncbi:protein translocase subunit SecD [Candidatus Dependentiae bacterium]|nr:protein translocase subunit SecD [Candidatus Dependentiae bacterium]